MTFHRTAATALTTLLLLPVLACGEEPVDDPPLLSEPEHDLSGYEAPMRATYTGRFSGTATFWTVDERGGLQPHPDLGESRFNIWVQPDQDYLCYSQGKPTGCDSAQRAYLTASIDIMIVDGEGGRVNGYFAAAVPRPTGGACLYSTYGAPSLYGLTQASFVDNLFFNDNCDGSSVSGFLWSIEDSGDPAAPASIMFDVDAHVGL